MALSAGDLVSRGEWVVTAQGIEGGEHELEAERELIRRVVVGGDERRGGLVEVGELVRRELGKVDVLDHVRELMG